MGVSVATTSPRAANEGNDTNCRRRSLRVQLLVTVNAIAFVGLAVWLVLDYRRELADQLAHVRAALTNEARTLAPLLAHLHRSQPVVVQAVIDKVCLSMAIEDSPNHHIVVRVNGHVYESTPHPETDCHNAAVHDSAPEHGRPNTGDDLSISGQYQAGNLSVKVSKSTVMVMGEVRRRAATRLSVIASGTVILALITNLLIVRLVNRPLTRLVAVVRKIAAGGLGLTPGRFDTAELDFLAREIGQMSLSLAAVEKDRRAQLAKARELQEHLSPSPGELIGLEFVAAYMPADNVAGDYYDAFPLRSSDGEGPAFMLCLADVCGHGVSAAMGAAMLKILLLDACERTSDPAAVLSLMNRRFAEVSLPGDFASVFLALVRPGAGELAYASAGHEHGYLVGVGGRVCPLAATGTLVGIEPQWSWETRRVAVQAGDRLLLVSDGVTEAVNAQNRQFGRERLAELLHTVPVATDGLLRAVQSALSEHTRDTPLRDDVTIVVAGLDRVSATAGPLVALNIRRATPTAWILASEEQSTVCAPSTSFRPGEETCIEPTNVVVARSERSS